MRNFHLNRNHKFCPTINLSHLWSLVPEKVREEAKKNPEKVPVVDLVQFVSIFDFALLLFILCDDFRVRADRMHTVYKFSCNQSC